MYGFKIGDYHTYEDFGLQLEKEFNWSSPNPKTESVEIVGADDDIDLSEIYGDIFFEKYEVELDFSKLLPYINFEEFRADIVAKLHGKNLKVIIDNDKNYFRNAFVTVNCSHSGDVMCVCTITFKFESHKYKTAETVVEIISETEITETIVNARKRVVPTINASNNGMQIKINDSSLFSLLEGDNSNYELYLKQRNNTVYVQGNGTVTLTYREGVL